MENRDSGMLLIELLLVIAVVGLILVSGMAALNAVWQRFEREGKATHATAEPTMLEAQLKRAWQRRLNSGESPLRVEGRPISSAGETELLSIGWTYIGDTGEASDLELSRDGKSGWRLSTGRAGEFLNFHGIGRIYIRENVTTETGDYRTVEFSFPDIGSEFDAGFAIHKFW